MHSLYTTADPEPTLCFLGGADEFQNLKYLTRLKAGPPTLRGSPAVYSGSGAE